MALLIRVAAALLLATQLAAAEAQSASVAEDDLKAAFLYNFAKYVAWPAGTSGEPFRLCIVAAPAFARRIDNLVAGETIEGRPVMRDSPATSDAARGCQILYIAASEISRSERLIAAVRGRPVLIVGDSADFLGRGGMIAFVREGDRIRFDVDNVAAQNAGLTISSRLLRLARHVGPQESRP